ncbi:MAG: GAF domain-containing protein, partial [Synergistota bacterium]|nr:GAF domain-containing protein [Synergistota bacterium]
MEKQLGLLRYIQSVNRAVAITEACDFAVRAIADENLYANPSVFLLSEDGETLELEAWTGFEPQTRSIPKNTSLSWRSIRKEKHHIIDDTASCPDYVSGLPGSCSELNFPIRGPEGPLGVFSIESTSCGVFSEEDVETVSLLAAILGSTLTHLMTRERLAKSLKREETRNGYRKLILDLDKRLFGSRGLNDAVEYFMDAVQETFGFDKIYLFLRSGPERPLRLKSNRGKEASPESMAAVLKKGRGLVGKVIQSAKEVWCNDVTLNPDYYMDDEETLSEMAVPVLSGELLWGVLVVDEYHRNAFAREDAELVRVICNQIAVALEAIRNFEMTSRDLVLMQTIHDVVVQVATETSIDEMCRRTVGLLKEHTKYTVFEIDEVLDESTGEVRIVAASWTKDAEKL